MVVRSVEKSGHDIVKQAAVVNLIARAIRLHVETGGGGQILSRTPLLGFVALLFFDMLQSVRSQTINLTGDKIVDCVFDDAITPWMLNAAVIAVGRGMIRRVTVPRW